MRRRTLYFTCLASYLTGWVIAQSLYNRVLHHVRERDGDTYAEEIAFKAIDKYVEVTRADAIHGVPGTFPYHNHPRGTLCGETCPLRGEGVAG